MTDVGPSTRRRPARRASAPTRTTWDVKPDLPGDDFRCGGVTRRTTSRRAFTLVEILAALLMMAIIIPVAMEGMSIATRAGVLGQRKAAAMRVAERVLNELIVEGDATRPSSSGSIVDGANTYNWTMASETWPEDQMVQLTVSVTFTVQGSEYSVNLSTLRPPTSADLDASGDSQ